MSRVARQVESQGSRAKNHKMGQLTAKGFFGFENLEVYQLSKTLAKNLIPLLSLLPKQEQFGLADQLRRAGSSISLNIAEGKGRGSDRDFVRFLYQARGSLLEVVAALDLCGSLNYLTRAQTQAVFDETFTLNAKLTALIKSLSSALDPRP